MDLMHRGGGTLAPWTADRHRWIRDGAVVGLVTGYVGPASVAFGWSLHPVLLSCAVAFCLGGAVLAGLTAATVELARGRVSLGALALLLPAFASVLGTFGAAGAAVLVGAPVLQAGLFGGVAATVLVAVLWLPYTVSSAMGLPRWPWLVAASALAPALGWLARLTWMLF